jgi:hypothetical protein
MRHLFLITRARAREALPEIVRLLRQRGDAVTVVLIGPDAAYDGDPASVRLLEGPGRDGGLDAGRLHDLLFEHDRVVTW